MIITLCGSARFEPWFHMWNEALSLRGHCVFGLASYPSAHGGRKGWYTSAQKLVLDAVHHRKIGASDAIVVLNVFAYIGESTLREIETARRLGRKAYFLESWGRGRGVGEEHEGRLQRAAKAFGVWGCRSPVDTFSWAPSRFDIWHPDLLGQGSAERSAVVDMLDERVTAVVGGGW